MSQRPFRRRLAAIVAADVVGYKLLMQADESRTIAALDQARVVFRNHVDRHGGRVVDTAGDSVLCIFETATGAVRAALSIQEELAATANISSDAGMRFRVGVHLGEVVEKADGTIYGDGVNLAARLEGLSPAGGVCVSAAVCEQVLGKIEHAFTDIGEHSVKNVSKPVHAFT